MSLQVQTLNRVLQYKYQRERTARDFYTCAACTSREYCRSELEYCRSELEYCRSDLVCCRSDLVCCGSELYVVDLILYVIDLILYVVDLNLYELCVANDPLFSFYGLSHPFRNIQI
jgi:hypothetical protein